MRNFQLKIVLEIFENATNYKNKISSEEHSTEQNVNQISGDSLLVPCLG